MAPDTQQPRRVITRRDGATSRGDAAISRESGSSYSFAALGDSGRAQQAARAGNPDAVAWPSHSSSQTRAGAKHAQEDAGIVAALPFAGVLVVTIVGVYIAWHQGSTGGGAGGAVGGVALLIAAIVRLLLPTRLAGLLAARNRANDVVTLTIFGTSLLVAGLVLPG